MDTLSWIKLVGVLVLAAAGITWAVFQWHECRELGFSIFYCVQHIG